MSAKCAQSLRPQRMQLHRFPMRDQVGFSLMLYRISYRELAPYSAHRAPCASKTQSFSVTVVCIATATPPCPSLPVLWFYHRKRLLDAPRHTLGVINSININYIYIYIYILYID